ncbi:hypothetical protein [Actinoplanes palleronii]|nr:hypothetical protein [Actinoplanes palleronii]
MATTPATMDSSASSRGPKTITIPGVSRTPPFGHQIGDQRGRQRHVR